MDFGKHKRKYGFFKWIRNITSHFFFCVCKILHCIDISKRNILSQYFLLMKIKLSKKIYFESILLNVYSYLASVIGS